MVFSLYLWSRLRAYSINITKSTTFCTTIGVTLVGGIEVQYPKEIIEVRGHDIFDTMANVLYKDNKENSKKVMMRESLNALQSMPSILLPKS